MDLAFKTKALRTLCLSEEAMDERFGAEAGAQLRTLLADMRAASGCGDIPLAQVVERKERGGAVSLTVARDMLRISIAPNHQIMPRTENGSMDWERVERALILKVEHQ